MTDTELLTQPGICKSCGATDTMPGRRICKKCYNQKCKEYRQEFPVSAEYWTEYREKNRARLTKYNREYMQKRRKNKKLDNSI